MDEFICEDFDPRYMISWKQLELSVQVGGGAYGVVHLAYLDVYGKKLKVAIKSARDESGPLLQDWLRELKLMTEVDRHINVLSLLGVTVAPDQKLSPIFEFCEFGSLKDYIINMKKKFRLFSDCRTKKATFAFRKTKAYQNKDQSRDQIDHNGQIPYTHPNTGIQKPAADAVITDFDLIFYAYQAACGMEFLSSLDIIHRDLALRNMLMTSGQIVKVSDFGCARRYEVSKNTKQAISWKWMALEVLTEMDFSLQSDILERDPYYFLSTAQELGDYLKCNSRLDAPKNCPKKIVKLMWERWNKDKTRRPPFAACEDRLSKAAQLIAAKDWQNKLEALKTAFDDSMAELSIVESAVKNYCDKDKIGGHISTDLNVQKLAATSKEVNYDAEVKVHLSDIDQFIGFGAPLPLGLLESAYTMAMPHRIPDIEEA